MKTKDPCNLGRPKAIANGVSPRMVDLLFTEQPKPKPYITVQRKDTPEMQALRQRYLTGH